MGKEKKRIERAQRTVRARSRQPISNHTWYTDAFPLASPQPWMAISTKVPSKGPRRHRDGPWSVDWPWVTLVMMHGRRARTSSCTSPGLGTRWPVLYHTTVSALQLSGWVVGRYLNFKRRRQPSQRYSLAPAHNGKGGPSH